ncbi:1-aminocyclopropane-1-carboxylate deaminase [Streptomyces zagrosensis]|uniref:1-aminocyclopropane-1-carboxylate deaminase n=1 Tax=Streptomyces zagrosensis TaxID=1042984 RepID=A0A7W9QAX3_9ACTN|nr:1-aminocyclopropane-1-carboxylate deaminase [Streptomyces zagrosensis]
MSSNAPAPDPAGRPASTGIDAGIGHTRAPADDETGLGSLHPRLPSPLQEVKDARFARHGVRLLLKRDDLIHPELPGNKWRKLELNLRAAADTGPRPLLTFGGAYSNHLRATAAAGRLLGLPTIGVVRGNELASQPLNPVLRQCAADGMRLHFLTRSAYRHKAEPEVLDALRARFGACYVIPEGGSNALAAQGCATLGRELRAALASADGPLIVGVACGTGGTLAGLAAGLAEGPEPRPRVIGFPVLKGGFLGAEVAALQAAAFGARTGDWELNERFHGGGYARTTPEIDAFAQDFTRRHGLVLDRIYVAKMLYGLTILAEEGTFAPGATVIAVITGPALTA